MKDKKYFKYLKTLVKHEERIFSYEKLLGYLYKTPFRWSIGMDENRAKDGIDLRTRYRYFCDYGDSKIEESGEECSVLEMMIALAIRMDGIMSEDTDVDNAARWFWEMIENIDLMPEDDQDYDESYVDGVITRWLDRNYKSNGVGGLFPLLHPNNNQKDTEIWGQMNNYLVENYPISLN